MLHLDGDPRALRVRQRDRRAVEAAFRSLDVRVVDSWGAQVDDSQFVKEADSAFNRKIGPSFCGFYVLAFMPRLYLWWQNRRGRATIV